MKNCGPILFLQFVQYINDHKFQLCSFYVISQFNFEDKNFQCVIKNELHKYGSTCDINETILKLLYLFCRSLL